jgi:hypothetical protein
VIEWNGFPVLEVMPNRTGSVDEEISRRFVALDQETGKPWHDSYWAAPAPARSFLWTAFGREEIDELLAFLDAVKGQAVPFWLPTWQRDLRLTLDAIQNETILTVRWVRFTQLAFPDSGARRHLAVYSVDQAASYHTIADADDPADGETESITVNPAAPRLWPVSSTILSFLALCRLDEDEVEIAFPTTGVCEATLRIREVPQEAPLT